MSLRLPDRTGRGDRQHQRSLPPARAGGGGGRARDPGRSPDRGPRPARAHLELAAGQSLHLDPAAAAARRRRKRRPRLRRGHGHRRRRRSAAAARRAGPAQMAQRPADRGQQGQRHPAGSRQPGRFVVLGIGVNIASHPADTPYPATDLVAAGAAPIAPQALLERLLAAFAPLYDSWERAGFAAAAAGLAPPRRGPRRGHRGAAGARDAGRHVPRPGA